MASPAVVGTPSETSISTDTGTSHTVNRPAGVAGQLTIVIFGFDGGSAITLTPPEGYTQFFRQDDTTSYGVAGFYHYENGSEGTTFAMGISAAEKSASVVYSISGAANPNQRTPEATTTTAGSSTTKDSPSISPTGGSKDYLFIAGFCDDGEEADDDTWANNTPTNYTNLRQITSGIGGATTTNVSLATSQRQNTTATEDPPSQTGATDVAHISCLFTVAIHPFKVFEPALVMAPRRAP